MPNVMPEADPPSVEIGQLQFYIPLL